jgi:hypothetical protein
MNQPTRQDFMRALLQQPGTGLYFLKQGDWTADYREAYDFKSSVNARGFCLKQGLMNVQIVLKFDTDKYDIVLPAYYPMQGQSEMGGPNPGL